MLAEQLPKIANIVVGLGMTGMACARYLAKQGAEFLVVDSRQQPPFLAQCRKELPGVDIKLGAFQGRELAAAERLIVSPGVPLSEPAIQYALNHGSELISDIDLFCLEVTAPIVAVTGSNGKSTVASLMGEMAANAGRRVAVGGNIGEPVLNLLEQEEQELYVLELSSFQLEMVHQLKAEVATILNISQDHMDRYPDFAAYRKAKQRIFKGCKQAVENRHDTETQPLLDSQVKRWRYGLDEPTQDELGVISEEGERYICLGQRKLIAASELALKGEHNLLNAMAALGMGYAIGLDEGAMLDTLRQYKGLPHRCEWVGSHAQVDYINDSKATNVGACQAAINSLGAMIAGKLVLIAGGDSKGADLKPLVTEVSQYCKAVLLIGKDAEKLGAVLTASGVELNYLDSLEAAVEMASAQAKPGDTVLLSPACASLDMFANYEERGQVFADSVKELGHAN